MTSKSELVVPELQDKRLSDNTNSDQIALERDIRAKTALEENLQQARNRHNKALAIGLPVLLLILIIELAFWEKIYRWLFFDPESNFNNLFRGYGMSALSADFLAVVVRAGTLGLVTVGVAALFYYFRYRLPLTKAKQALNRYQEKLLQERIKTADGWYLYLQEELRRLSHIISRVFLDNPNRAGQARKWLKQADQIIEKKDESGLVEAQTLVSSINKLILAEEDELQEQRNWRIFAVGVMIFYILALGILAVFTGFSAPSNELYVFGIPILIVIWGGLGSFAAILYRFYTLEKRVRFDIEVRWLIARPIIGVIMGALAYLVLSSGLILLSAQPDNTQQEVFWVVAFLAGFSDKFYIGIINLLVHRTIGEKEESEKIKEQ